MNPAQCVKENVELTGIITQDDQVRIDAVGYNAGQQGALGNDLHMALRDDTQLAQLLRPSFAVWYCDFAGFF